MYLNIFLTIYGITYQKVTYIYWMLKMIHKKRMQKMIHKKRMQKMIHKKRTNKMMFF